jgi:thiol-disulfide isomerase/thioredoxin
MRIFLLFLLMINQVLTAVEFPLSGPSLVGEAGEKIEINPLTRGRPVLLVFWNSWCTACVREMPALKQFHTTAGERIDLITCTIDTDVAAARACVAKHQLTYPVILDKDMAIADLFSVDATPTMVLIGVDGREIARGRSLSKLSDALTTLGVIKQ